MTIIKWSKLQRHKTVIDSIVLTYRKKNVELMTSIRFWFEAFELPT